MSRENKKIQALSWANVFLLSASLTLQASPTRAFADENPNTPLAGNGGNHGGGHGGGHGPGNGPKPTPTFAPKPVPTGAPAPAPAPTNAPPAPNTNAARSQGRSDATPDGSREGNERGTPDGERAGKDEGYRDGFNRCEKQEEDRNHDLGFQRGYGEGQVVGGPEGRIAGDRDGAIRGANEGQADGIHRADRDSYDASTPKGQADGISQANSSDASSRGAQDGTVRGDAQALAEAQSSDYPRGRKDYNQDRYAEKPQRNDVIQQKPAPIAINVAEALKQVQELTAALAATAPGPDFRYFQLKHNYPTPQENTAYADGARAGYREGFQSSYSSSYNKAYRSSYDRSKGRGCDEARRRDYRDDFARGQREGRDRGYRESYDRNYTPAAQQAYAREFGPASAQSYQRSYNGLYQKHYEEARAAAYAAQVDRLYQSAFESARRNKHDQMYPVYATSEYKRGQKDEAKDFADRPIRITGAEATETIVNGVFEPGEPLRLRLGLRNFSESDLKSGDISVVIQAQDSRKSVITEASSSLASSLRAKSTAEVREALEFRMNESAIGSVQSFNVKIMYKGKLMDSEVFDVQTSYMLATELAETPSFKEGLPMPIRLKVTNLSKKPAHGVSAQIKVDPKLLEIAQPVVSVGDLDAGESKVVEFSAVGQNISSYQSIPLGFVLTDNGGAGRRIGALDLTGQFPVVNDYRIQLTAAADGLRNPGVVRLPYQVKDISRRLVFNSLQVKVSFVGVDDASDFVVIGPNPQFLMPLDQNETASFVVPVLVKNANSGGTLQIEVQEAGRTVVIHRVDFSQSPKRN